MAAKIRVEVGGVAFDATLYEGQAPTAFAKALPLEFRASRWGDEYYGNCGLSLKEDETVRDLMEVGELAFWAPGSAFCVFFGRTPASTDGRPRAASDVIPLGKIIGDATALKPLGSSVVIKLSAG